MRDVCQCILVDRPQKTRLLCGRVFQDILITETSQVIPTLALEEELAQPFFQYSFHHVLIPPSNGLSL